MATSEGEAFDVVVVGASFGGLSFAGAAAAHGLRVLVLERDAQVGGVVRTTGVLFSDVLDIFDVPARFLMNAVRRIQIYAVGREPITVESRAYRFFMADVTGMLRWMADEAAGHGVEIRSAAPFRGAQRDADGLMTITYGRVGNDSTGNDSAGTATVRAACVVGADGAQSTVARQMGLDQNRSFLAGAEWLVEGVEIDRETFMLVMDHQLAPGYCVWLAPHEEIAAFGVAGHQRSFKPHESLRLAQDVFGRHADLSRMTVRQKKGGIIPVGGQLRRVWRDDERGRALLIGDAAGLCGAATGGGIYPALLCGRLAAHAVANEILNGTKGSVQRYLHDLPRTGGLGPYLKVEDWLRRALDQIGSNADITAFYGLFATPSGNAILRRTLFETPIISMDGGFFAMIRGLLGQGPAIYGAALRSLVHRVGQRG